MNQKSKFSDEKKERIKHIFQFMEYDTLTEGQENLVISFESFFINNGFLTEKQLEILENIFKQAAENY